MAGSYEHLLGDDGGWSLIEHMGDAFECVQELWWLVEREIGEEAAKNLLDSEFYPMLRGELAADAAFTKVQDGMSK